MLRCLLDAGRFIGTAARKFIRKEDGDVNVVAIVVLIGVAVLLAILFKDQIANLIKSLIDSITQNADNAINEKI